MAIKAVKKRGRIKTAQMDIFIKICPRQFFALCGFIALCGLSVTAPSVSAYTEAVPVCLDVTTIRQYQVASDRVIDFILQKAEADKNVTIRASLTPGCQNLFFHNYVSYIPIYDQICVGKNILKTRTGHRCRIEEFKQVKN